MSLWWLSASAEELDAARTCRGCGCKDADIDLGLCFDCFNQEQGQSKPAEIEVRQVGALQQRINARLKAEGAERE